MRFSDEGLTFGAGTVLATRRHQPSGVSIEVDEARLSALLAAAHLRAPSPGGLAHIRKAADCWTRGEVALADMHLALSSLSRLEQPAADAHRLLLADALLQAGFAAEVIFKALGLDDTLAKYSPDQPRVPAGSGHTSGQWTVDGAPATDPASPGPSRDAESHDARTFSVHLLRPGIVPAALPGPVGPFGDAVKAMADAVEVADSISKWKELGPKGEAAIVEAVEAKGWSVLGTQIAVRTTLGLRIEDVMVRLPPGTVGNDIEYDGFIEVKVNGGRYNALQQAKDAIIGTKGGILLTPVLDLKYMVGAKIVLETGLANVKITYQPSK